MTTIRTGPLAVLATAAALALTVNTASFAAGGPSLLLGHRNKADSTTSLRAKAGPALKLQAKPGTAPLAVSNATLVERLNADRVDGLDAATIQAQAVGEAVARAKAEIKVPAAPGPTYRVAPFGIGDTFVIQSGGVSFTVPTGDYLVSLQGLLRPGPGSSADGYECAVQDKALAESGNQSAIGASFLYQSGDANAGDGALDQQVFAHVDGTRPLKAWCRFDDPVRQVRSVQVLFEPAAVTDLASTPLPAP